MDPYIILAKTEQGVWIETKEIGTSQWSLQQLSKIKQEQLILAQVEDSKKGQLIYLTRKGSFQVILYKMIRFLSGKLKKHTKLAKIVKISEIFNQLVFPLNFNRFCHPMTVNLRNPLYAGNEACKWRIHPIFGTQGRCQQKSETGVSVTPQKGLMSSKKFTTF